MHIISSVDDAKALEGVEVGVSDWIVVDQHRIDQFAEATADHQWIHVDTERAAREMPGGKTIAHGYLTLALIPALTGGFVEVPNLERAINFARGRLGGFSPSEEQRLKRLRKAVSPANRTKTATIAAPINCGVRAINFGLNKVRFYTPVPVGSRLRARATVLQARRRAGALLLTSEVRLEVEGERKPACVAETLGMYFFRDG